MPQKGRRIVAQNKKAWHDYFVQETLEAGIELCGTEVKSVRMGRLNLKDAWCAVDGGELFIRGMHISPYEKGNIFNRDPLRERKTLLHKREIVKLYSLVTQKGLTLVPLTVYLKKGKVKLELGVARGKKLYDKRASIAERDAQRSKEVAMKMAR